MAERERARVRHSTTDYLVGESKDLLKIQAWTPPIQSQINAARACGDRPRVRDAEAEKKEEAERATAGVSVDMVGTFSSSYWPSLPPHLYTCVLWRKKSHPSPFMKLHLTQMLEPMRAPPVFSPNPSTVLPGRGATMILTHSRSMSCWEDCAELCETTETLASLSSQSWRRGRLAPYSVCGHTLNTGHNKITEPKGGGGGALATGKLQSSRNMRLPPSSRRKKL